MRKRPFARFPFAKKYAMLSSAAYRGKFRKKGLICYDDAACMEGPHFLTLRNFTLEDDKCFIMEFCVYPEFRGSSTGHACGEALLSWARERRASYFELNCDTAPRERFWGRLGFLPNGCDEWNIPLMLRPPEEDAPITVRQFVPGADDWQLWKLENGYLAEIGETPLDERKQAQLLQAIQEERITFFAAYRKTRMVGMCSVSRVFSTFACADIGVFEDFFVEPVFRKQGAARQLASAAQEYGRANHLASLAVTCALCDEGMYRALGFTEKLGTTLVHLS